MSNCLKRECGSESRIKKGDVILAGGNREIDSIDDWFDVIDEAGPGEVVKLNVRRELEETEEPVNLHL